MGSRLVSLSLWISVFFELHEGLHQPTVLLVHLGARADVVDKLFGLDGLAAGAHEGNERLHLRIGHARLSSSVHILIRIHFLSIIYYAFN